MVSNIHLSQSPPINKKIERRLEEEIRILRESAQEKEAQAISRSHGLPYINLKTFPIDRSVIIMIPEEKARKANLAIFFREDRLLKVGVTDPNDSKTKAVVEELVQNGFKPSLFVVSQSSLQHALDLYKEIIRTVSEEERLGLKREYLENALNRVKEIAKLHGLEISVTEIINIILGGAVATSASDIHLEPEKEKTKLRYRIDGVLQDIIKINPYVYSKILSRIKLVSGVKINISDIPQDGRFTIKVEEKEIDLRVSTLPTGYGETIVIRLLGTATSLNILELGFRERDLNIVMKEIQKPNGMILTTGPTGSGKTTSLYAFLNQINTPEIKIITLENPIEFRLEGISQTQIDPDAGMTFATGLRAILRQDPDVVMVGEIRDLETAEIASQAALTGHIVFSTLHTNDSSGVIPRLINMGLRPFVVAPALNCAIAQRLVRVLCPKCKESYKPDAQTLERLKIALGSYFPKEGVKVLYKSKGCEKCSGIGYKGRLGIFEVFSNTREISDLINERASSTEIMDAARKQGMTTMEQDGYLKAFKGITSIEEVERVT